MRAKRSESMPATVVHMVCLRYPEADEMFYFFFFFLNNLHLIIWEPERSDWKLAMISRFPQRIAPPSGIHLL